MTTMYLTGEPLMVGPVSILAPDYTLSMGTSTTFVCPTCRERRPTTLGQVDRVKVGGVYAPGNVVMICRGCNVTRADDKIKLNLDLYRSDVEKANELLVDARGVVRGPKAFTPDMIQLIKGEQSQSLKEGYDVAKAALLSGPYRP